MSLAFVAKMNTGLEEFVCRASHTFIRRVNPIYVILWHVSHTFSVRQPAIFAGALSTFGERIGSPLLAGTAMVHLQGCSPAEVVTCRGGDLQGWSGMEARREVGLRRQRRCPPSRKASIGHIEHVPFPESGDEMPELSPPSVGSGSGHPRWRYL